MFLEEMQNGKEEKSVKRGKTLHLGGSVEPQPKKIQGERDGKVKRMKEEKTRPSIPRRMSKKEKGT